MAGDEDAGRRQLLSPSTQALIALVAAVGSVIWNAVLVGRTRGHDESALRMLTEQVSEVRRDVREIKELASTAHFWSERNRDDVQGLMNRLNRMQDGGR